MKYFIYGFIFLTIHMIGLYFEKIFNLPRKNNKIASTIFHGPILLRPIAYIYFSLYLIQNKKKLKLLLTIPNIIIFISLTCECVKYCKQTINSNKTINIIPLLIMSSIYLFSMTKLLKM